MKALRVGAGLGWTSAATLLNMLLQFGFLAVLARQLEAGDFGLMLMAAVATRFATYFAQVGGAQTLIQEAELTPELATAGLVLAGGVSMMLYLGLVLATPAFVWYFKSDQLASVLMIYGLSLPLTAVGSLPMALLRRQGRFQASSTIEVLSYALGYGVTGISLALTGHGVWSLVLATLAQQSLVLILATLVARFPLVWPVPKAALQRVLSRGSRYSVIGFFEFLWANVESLLVGRLFDASALGQLNRAQLVCNLPVEQAVNAGNKVLFPAMSAMQRDRARLADGFLLMLMASGLLSVVLSASISAAAPDVVALLLGPRWTDAVPLVAVLAFGVPAMFGYVACGIALDSIAALGAKLRLQAAALVVKVLAVWLLAHWGLVGLAFAVVACEYLRLALGLRLVVALLELPARMVRLPLLLLTGLALAIFAAVLACRTAALAWGLPLVLRLAMEGFVAALVALCVLVPALLRWGSFAPFQRFQPVRRLIQQLQKLFLRTAQP